MCVEFRPKDLNLGSCLPHPTSTYIYGMTIAPRVRWQKIIKTKQRQHHSYKHPYVNYNKQQTYVQQLSPNPIKITINKKISKVYNIGYYRLDRPSSSGCQVEQPSLIASKQPLASSFTSIFSVYVIKMKTLMMYVYW